jgi:hypothetical protein
VVEGSARPRCGSLDRAFLTPAVRSGLVGIAVVDAWAHVSRQDRDRAFGNAVPIDMSVLDYWRHWLRPGDRYWVQMPFEAFSTFGDKKLLVREIARLYLLPSVESPTLAGADVVLTWDANPNLLHLRFSDQQRAGEQNIYYSRIDDGP